MKKQVRITIDSANLDYLVSLQGNTITEKLNLLLTSLKEKEHDKQDKNQDSYKDN